MSKKVDKSGLIHTWQNVAGVTDADLAAKKREKNHAYNLKYAAKKYATTKAWRGANRERYRELLRNHYALHRDEILAKRRARRREASSLSIFKSPWKEIT